MTVVAQSMEADGAEEFLCLGTSWLLFNPNEVVELIESLNCWKILLGNHDSACVGTVSLAKSSPPAAEAIRWTRTKSSRRTCAFSSPSACAKKSAK